MEIEKKDLEKMHKSAQKVVLGFVTSTSVTGAVPIPRADMTMLVGQQVAMLASINAIYKLNVSKNKLNTLVVAVLEVGGTAMIGRTVATSLIKMIPGIGSLAGGAISVGTAGTLTLALGKAYMEVCEAVKKGELKETALSEKEGLDLLKKSFKKYVKSEETAKDEQESIQNDSDTFVEDGKMVEDENEDFKEI